MTRAKARRGPGELLLPEVRGVVRLGEQVLRVRGADRVERLLHGGERREARHRGRVGDCDENLAGQERALVGCCVLSPHCTKTITKRLVCCSICSICNGVRRYETSHLFGNSLYGG